LTRLELGAPRLGVEPHRHCRDGASLHRQPFGSAGTGGIAMNATTPPSRF